MPLSLPSSTLDLTIPEVLDFLNYCRQPRSIPLSITLRRRERDLRRRLEQQQAQGRPRSTWKLCGDPTCQESCCMNKVPLYILKDKDYSIDNITVRQIASDFAGLAGDKLWATRDQGADNFVRELYAVESLANSPPVRVAFLEFRPYCAKLGFEGTAELRLRLVLLDVMPLFYELMDKIGKPKYAKTIHTILRRPREKDVGESWTMKDCIMRFLLTVELWRRSDIEHLQRRRWTFQSSSIVAQLLCAILLHLWQLNREKSFDTVPCVGSVHWSEIWQEWVDKYPLLTQEGEKDDDYQVLDLNPKSYDFVPRLFGDVTGLDVEKELGYLGAVGICAESWRPRCLQRHEDDGLPQH